MTRMTTDTARKDFAGTIKRVSRQHERIVLRHHGKDVMAMVPMNDLKLIEKIEDRLDIEGARKALAEMKASGEKPIPYEEYRRKRLRS